MSRKAQMRFRKRWSPLKKICVAIGILLVMLVVFNYSFKLTNIEIDDCSYYSKEELIKYIKKDKWDNNTVLFYFRNRSNSGVEIPFIQKITVEYKNASSVKVRVYEKPIIGCIEYMNEYIYFDKDGKVLEISSVRMKEVPLYSGVSFKSMKLYDTLAVDKTDIFMKILDLSQLIDKYELNIDRVVFDSRQNVTMYAGDVKVLLGNKESYDDPVGELVSILPKLSGHKGELDLKNYKSGQTSIIFKEMK